MLKLDVGEAFCVILVSVITFLSNAFIGAT